ncbi:Carbohydrate kinase [gamma proteobacterium HdN1]|nr:Carbohydrate kinase [gamma proteobacterium HdN1]
MNTQRSPAYGKKDRYLLAIDNGTQSVRALIFDLDGQLIAKSKVNIEPYYSTHPGWAEQDADYLWNALCQACMELWEQIDFPKESIHAVALTTQRASVVNVDQDGVPLRPAIIWLDQRRTEPVDLPAMPLHWQLLFRAIGEQDTVDYFRSQAECNWIFTHQSDLWKKTHKTLLLSGWHTWKLTGRYVDSVAAQVGYQPFDFKRFTWCKPQDWKWHALPTRPEMLPDLVPPGGLLGRITADATRQTGIPEGLPLISAGADKACEVIGSGCLSPDIGSLSYGTTATFNTCNKQYVEAIPHIPPYPAAIPDTYNTEIIIPRGYWMVNWFRKEFGLREEKLAQQRGVEPEVLFDELLKSVPAGSMGLMLQPYWSPGVRVPGPEAKGSIVGFGDVHTRAHIYRAIIEGLGYALREGKERVEARSGVKIRSLRVSGGGSQSDEAMQITADIFGLPAERPHTYETSGLGAAINAAVGAGLYPNHAMAIQRMTHAGDIFRPIEANRKVYQQLYTEVYQKMYDNLSPLYRSIRKITGYPR